MTFSLGKQQLENLIEINYFSLFIIVFALVYFQYKRQHKGHMTIIEKNLVVSKSRTTVEYTEHQVQFLGVLGVKLKS